MGWIWKAVVLFVGLALLGSGFWPFGILCLGYLVVPFFYGKRKDGGPTKVGLAMSSRYVLASILLFLSLLALASGGTLSPIVFGVLAALALLWPLLPFGSFISGVVPVGDTILLRSSLVPFVWHSVAEVKPGAEDLGRALSSFGGRLVIMKRGSVYVHIRATALDARSAEEKVTKELRRTANSITPGGAYLLPLDCGASSKVFSGGYASVSHKSDPLAGPAPDLLLLDASNGLVSRYGSYDSVKGSHRGIIIPENTRAHHNPPLTWEALERLGKKLEWPAPDSYSNLLQSVHASRNEFLAERLESLETEGGQVKVRALGGEESTLSRAQLRAILSIYS